jgi:hypothetical protein
VAHFPHGTWMSSRIRELQPANYTNQWQSAFFGDQPNDYQPLVQPDINKETESQIKGQHQLEVRHQDKRHLTEVPIHTLLPDQSVTTQVQCPKDLNDMTCVCYVLEKG